jgi:hypothetical protein
MPAISTTRNIASPNSNDMMMNMGAMIAEL